LANPATSLSLASDMLFVGNSSGKAEAVAKTSLAISAFGGAEQDILMGDAVTQYNIKHLADPLSSTDAVNKRYVDDLFANPSLLGLASGNFYVGNSSGYAEGVSKSDIPLSGFGHATADIEIGDATTPYKILNLKTPGSADAASTAATKGYVDNAIASLAVPGNLYQGTVSDVAAFLALDWSTVSAATNLGSFTAIPQKICDLSTSGYTWIAYPASWDISNFFYQYNSQTYAVFDGFQKRIISSATTGSVDYQVWIFKTTPNITVSLITQN
jgi:hypothetical protein